MERGATCLNERIAVIGGCGHVGLPLGIKFALAGASVSLVDIDRRAVDRVNAGVFPFAETGGDAELARALRAGLVATEDPGALRTADVVVIVTGTPVDEHMNPKISEVLRVFDAYLDEMGPGALVVLRSTLYPGTTEHLVRRVRKTRPDLRLAYCPERVAEGAALREIESLPQIVSALEEPAFEAARRLFAAIAPKIVRLEPLEAELAKLMANSWRYLEFAIANQFYAIAERAGLDFFKVFDAIRFDYPRAAGYKAPGFAAGPCLFKDTMQLAAFSGQRFPLGAAAVTANEELATVVVERARALFEGELWGRRVGLLGMTFKRNSDDTRESLSFRVKKELQFAGADVLWHDPFLEGGTGLQQVLEECEALVVCTPHDAYRELTPHQPVIDVWGLDRDRALRVFDGTEAASN